MIKTDEDVHAFRLVDLNTLFKPLAVGDGKERAAPKLYVRWVENMKTDPESLIKKSIRSIAASFPGASSLAQWWSEMEADAQSEAIEGLKDDISRIKNPILFSHPQAKLALLTIYDKIEITKTDSWEVDDSLREHMEVLSLWEKQQYISVQHAIGHRWKSICLTNPIFVMAIYSAKHGDLETLKLKKEVWGFIKSKGGGTHAEPISEALNITLVYLDYLFQIFESEGQGWKSKTQGETYFQPYPEFL